MVSESKPRLPEVRRLHWVNPTRTPYWSYLFAALAADPAIELTVHYASLSHPLYPWRARGEDAFPHRVFARRLFDAEILRVAADPGQRLAVAGWQTPAQVVLLLELAALRRPYMFFTDTPVERPRALLKGAARNALARTVLRSASAVLTTGAPGIEALQAMGCPAGKLVNLPYICDPQAFRRRADPPDDGVLRIASCGRLVPIKAYDVALRAVAALKRVAPDIRFRYEFAGVGPEESALRSLAGELGLAREVRFRGWLEAEAVRDLLQRCDVFLHPAAREPYGVAILEAMAAGAVVLGSAAAGAVRDRLVHGHNGLVHPVGDAARLAAQLVDLARDCARIRRIGRAAAATAEAWPAARGVAIVKDALART